MHSFSKYKISAADRYTSFLLPILLIIVDYIAIVSAEQVAFVIRNFLIPNGGVLHISWFNFWVVFPLLYLIFINVEQLYTCRKQFWQVIEKIFHASFYSVISIIIVLYIGQINASTSRLFIFLFWIFAFGFLVFFRYIVKKILEKMQLLQIPVLIIGAGKTAELLVQGIINDAGMGYKIIGLLEDNCVKDGILTQFPVLGKFVDAEKVIADTGVQYVFIAVPGLEQSKLTRLIYKVQPLVKNMGIIPNLVGVPMGSIEVESLFNEKLMLLRLRNNLTRPFNRLIKNVFDIIASVIVSIVFLPVVILIIFKIYSEEPGSPIFYRYTCVGENGKKFCCYKFRTMCINSQEVLDEYLHKNSGARMEWEKYYKLKNDPRISRIGNFLRKTSLDELPQLINVFKGEMSLVGPRQIIEDEIPKFGVYIQDYYLVKPGITGYWQISGRNDVDYSKRVKMVSWYIRNWSLWLDFYILYKTIRIVLLRKGAY